MSRKLPLWTAVLPLAVGLAGYGWLWTGQRDRFHDDIVAVLGPQHGVTMSGFPYRLEADVGAVMLRRARPDSFMSLTADAVRLNRQPWRHALTVANADNPRLQLTAPDIAAARLDVEARHGQASLHIEDGSIARLSGVFDGAIVWLPLLPQPLHAETFELHFRETPTTAKPAGRAPKGPDQAQARIAGRAQLTESGAPVTFEADLGITADAPIASVSGWRQGGTLEIRRMTLADDKAFTFATLNATLAALPDGRVAISGVVETSCPQTVAALFQGTPPAEEFRTRKPRRYALSGYGAKNVTLKPFDDVTRGPARSREPPCPVLRR